MDVNTLASGSPLVNFSVLLVLASAMLDIVANVLLAKSQGFKKKILGYTALALVGLAFWLLSKAVKELDLSVAYALWGCFGILGTSLCGWIFLGQKMRWQAFAGMALLFCGIILLRL